MMNKRSPFSNFVLFSLLIEFHTNDFPLFIETHFALGLKNGISLLCPKLTGDSPQSSLASHVALCFKQCVLMTPKIVLQIRPSALKSRVDMQAPLQNLYVDF